MEQNASRYAELIEKFVEMARPGADADSIRDYFRYHLEQSGVDYAYSRVRDDIRWRVRKSFAAQVVEEFVNDDGTVNLEKVHAVIAEAEEERLLFDQQDHLLDWIKRTYPEAQYRDYS